MDAEEIKMHLNAGRYFGRGTTCGIKQVHANEESAAHHANSVNNSGRAMHVNEAYPCYWCSPGNDGSPASLDPMVYNWHIGRKMTGKERLVFSSYMGIEMDVITINDHAEPVYGIQGGPAKLKVHNPLLCQGEYCSVHNPSPHHMVSWPRNWRGDRGIMERLCPHGIGHRDPDDMAFRISAGIDDDGTHGCDGCCVPPYKED